MSELYYFINVLPLLWGVFSRYSGVLFQSTLCRLIGMSKLHIMYVNVLAPLPGTGSGFPVDLCRISGTENR